MQKFEKPLIERLKHERPLLDFTDVPCLTCFENIRNCNSITCPKLDAWLITNGGN